MFTHLHNHTHGSDLDGLQSEKDYVNRLVELGQDAGAITDHGDMKMLFTFDTEARKQGIKPILGVEFYLAFGSRFEHNFEYVDNDEADSDAADEKSAFKTKNYMHLTVLARNKAGWRNLVKLHNKSWAAYEDGRDAYWHKPRIDFDVLKEHGEGLIVLTGCIGGPVSGPLMRAGAASAELTLLRKALTGVGDDAVLSAMTSLYTDEQVAASYRAWIAEATKADQDAKGADTRLLARLNALFDDAETSDTNTRARMIAARRADLNTDPIAQTRLAAHTLGTRTGLGTLVLERISDDTLLAFYRDRLTAMDKAESTKKTKSPRLRALTRLLNDTPADSLADTVRQDLVSDPKSASEVVRRRLIVQHLNTMTPRALADLALEFLEHVETTQRGLAYTNLDHLTDAVGKEHVFLETMFHGIGGERHAFREIRAMSEKTGIPLVATNDCHFTFAEDYVYHDGFLTVSANRTGSHKSIHDKDRFRFSGDGTYFVRSEQEMLDVLGNVPQPEAAAAWRQACENTQLVNALVEDDIIHKPAKGEYFLPKFPLPPGFEDARSYLQHRVVQGAVWRFGEDYKAARPDVSRRLASEFKIIMDMGFPDYFLITEDMINWARSDYTAQDWIASHGGADALPYEEARERKAPILVGVGRGSAAGSLISYCLGIVGVDPLENGLLFDRFLEPGREGMPDIDVDFERDRRAEVHAYLTLRWGVDKVAQIGTIQYALTKAAIKDAARILKPSDDYLTARQYHEVGEALASRVPMKGGKPTPIAQLLDRSDANGDVFREVYDTHGALAEEIVSFALKFEGVAKGSSIHACGFLISPDPLDELIPVRTNRKKGVNPATAPRVVCWDGPTCEAMGLLKNDVLGLMNLDIMSHTFAGLAENRGITMSFDDIPHPDTKDDPRVRKAFDLISRGATQGVFQMDGAGMQKVAQDVQPESLTDLSAIVALFRPGPLAAKAPERYAARKNGREAIDYSIYTNDPVEQGHIATILDKTYGVYVFQESLMQLGTLLAGFTPGQRSKMRKAMGKKDKAAMEVVGGWLMDGAEKEFFEEDGTLISPKFSPKTVMTMFELMKPSAEYLFNASHSAAYAYLAYATAFLKANYPVEFGAGLLTIAKDPDKRVTALRALRSEGISIAAPHINHSRVHTAAVGDDIVFGLAEIRSVGASAEWIVAEREANGPFTSLHNFYSRVRTQTPEGVRQKLSTTTMEALIDSGALDDFGPRAGMQASYRASFAHEAPILPDEYSPIEASRRQRQMLRIALGAHPVTLLGAEIEDADPSVGFRTPVYSYNGNGDPSVELGEQVRNLDVFMLRGQDGHQNGDDKNVLTYGIISSWEERSGASGTRANFSIETEFSSTDSVIFARALKPLRDKGLVPQVGDMVAVQGFFKNREVTRTIRPDESDVQLDEDGNEVLAEEYEETTVYRELTVTQMWGIEDRWGVAAEPDPGVGHEDFVSLYASVHSDEPLAREPVLEPVASTPKIAHERRESSDAASGDGTGDADEDPDPTGAIDWDFHDSPSAPIDWDDWTEPTELMVGEDWGDDFVSSPEIKDESAPQRVSSGYPSRSQLRHAWLVRPSSEDGGGTWRPAAQSALGGHRELRKPAPATSRSMTFRNGDVFRTTAGDGSELFYVCNDSDAENGFLDVEAVAVVAAYGKFPISEPVSLGVDERDWLRFNLFEHRP